MDIMQVNDPKIKITVTDGASAVEEMVDAAGEYIIFTNMETFPFYVKLGGVVGITATTDDTIIPPKSEKTMMRRPEQTFCAACADSGSGVLRVQYGSGA